MSYRLLVAAALVCAAAAQPNAQCNTESQALIAAGIAVSDPSCTALAAYEGCVARVEARPTQRALEIALTAYQEMMQGCSVVPVTAALRTKRNQVHVTGDEIIFHRTVRQTVNVHELASQVEANELALSTIRGETASTLAVSMSTMTSQMLASASTAASTAAASASTLEASTSNALSTSASAAAASASTLEASTSNALATSVSAMLSSAASTTTFVGAGLNAAARARASLNVSVQQAVVAAANAAVPTVYIQWGTKQCTAPGGVAIVKLYDGITYGTRHNYGGGGSTQLCLKNAAGDQGGVRQGGQDSNDMVVPLKQAHASYNQLPSRNNLLRSKEGWITPCAKCKYAKSCFKETGVAECPSGYHKMYTGYMYGGHQSHHGNNDRFCIDKNPQDNDYTSSQNWDGWVYPTLARSATGPGLARGNRVALACHQCCVH